MPTPRQHHSRAPRPSPSLAENDGKNWYLEGERLPGWWPKDPETGEPLHKLYRAMSKDLNELYNQPKRRSFRAYHEGHQCHIKRDTTNTGIKVNTVNAGGCKTTYVWTETDGWYKCEDRRPVEEISDFKTLHFA